MPHCQSKGWVSRGSAFLKALLMRPDDCIKRASKQCPNTILDFKENGGVLNASSTLPLTAGFHEDQQAALCGLLVFVPGEIMKPIPFNMKGTEYALTIKIATYPEGNLAIKLYQESFGQLVFWDSLTVNPGGLCPKDCGFINTKSTGKRFYAWIKRNGLGERTGQVRLEDGVEYVEYLFNAKKLKKLDPDGYTYYERRLKGELGRRYERLYLALRRLATTFRISTIQITADGAGCRTPSIRLHCGSRLKTPHITDTLPLSTAGSYCGPLSQTATPVLCRATCTVSGMIWRLICSPYIKVNFRSMRLGLKNAEEKVTQGMTRPLHKH